MSDNPKFEVVDRRKMKKDEEQESSPSHPAQAAEPESGVSGPHLVDTDEKLEESASPVENIEEEQLPEMPPPPSAQEKREQESAYEASAQRVEDLLRAQ